MTNPEKVLITAGHEVGGLTAFAEGLSEGFTALSIPSEVIPPKEIFKRWRDLRDAKVLKILSTTAVFAAPFARRVMVLTSCCILSSSLTRNQWELQMWAKIYSPAENNP